MLKSILSLSRWLGTLHETSSDFACVIPRADSQLCCADPYGSLSALTVILILVALLPKVMLASENQQRNLSHSSIFWKNLIELLIWLPSIKKSVTPYHTGVASVSRFLSTNSISLIHMGLFLLSFFLSLDTVYFSLNMLFFYPYSLTY